MSSFKAFLCAVAMTLSAVSVCGAQDAPDSLAYRKKIEAELKYEHRMDRRADFWSKLVPDMWAVQFAGGLGMISAGLGWDYGKNKQWETQIMLGFLPKRYNYHSYWTFTLREFFVPWRLKINDSWSVRPLTVALSVNSILHGDFWMSEPDRYPKGYYGFSSRMRFHLALGQRFTFSIPKYKRFLSKEVSLYYEVSTCELYVRQKILSGSIPLKDILMLGVGVIYTI